MRILQHVCSVLIALGVVPVPAPRTLARAASVPEASEDLRRTEPLAWLATRSRRSPASGPKPSEATTQRGLVGLVGHLGTDIWRRADVAAADGDMMTTMPAQPASSPAASEETSTEEPYDSEAEGGDFGSEILNALMEVIGTLVSFFTDPPGAIQKMVEQAKQLTGTARALMASVRAQRQAGLPVPDALPGYVEQVQQVVDAAIEVAKLGPVGARQARRMLEEARRILETAKGIVETSGKVANAARNVASSISRPWTG